MYKDMVRDKKLALGAASQATFPAEISLPVPVLPGPRTGHSSRKMRRSWIPYRRSVKKEKVDEARFQRVKTKLRAALIRKLDSNSGLAAELCYLRVNYGDWRKLFTELDDNNKVTADDVQRVAKKYLSNENRTVAYTYHPTRRRRQMTARSDTRALSIARSFALGCAAQARPPPRPAHPPRPPPLL